MEKFAVLIAQGAKILGLQVERLWPRIVWIYWVETLVQAFMAIPAFLLAVWLSKWFFRRAQAANAYDDTNVPLYAGGILCAPGALIILLVVLFSLGSTIATLLDPEAAYVRHLTDK